MKKLISLCCVGLILLASDPRAAEFITATLTMTNAPAIDGDTFTVNGNVRTWRTNVTTPATEIATGANIGAQTTNLFNHIASSPFPLVSLGALNATNIVTLRSAADMPLTAADSGTNMSIALSTNTSTSLTVVRVPMASLQEIERTNVASLLVTGLGAYAQNNFDATIKPFTNFVSTTANQTVAGDKTFSGSTTFNALATFLGNLSVVQITNTQFYVRDGWANGYLLFADSGDVVGAEINVDANGYPTLINNVGAPLDITPASSNVLNRISAENILGSLTLANTWTGTNTFTRITNSTIVNSTFNAGTYDGTIAALTNGVIQSAGLNNAIATNTTLKKINYTRLNHTALANGNNAGVDFATHSFIKIKAGPSAAFTINGIANGADGHTYLIYNSTGQNMTIAHESGVDPTPANRIITMTGADVTSTGNATAMLTYDSEDSRWILMNFQD